MTRAELLAALAAATGPDREIDAQIALLIGVVPEGAFRPCAALDIGTFATGDRYWTCERYTGSLDAAMTLVPEGWRLASIVIGWDGDAYYYDAQIARDDKPQDANGEHALIPFALCIAALSARAP